MAKLKFLKICLPLFLVLFTAKNGLSQANTLKIVKDNIACLYGLKDQNGIWVVEAEYLNITQRGKVFLVQQGEKYGVLDQMGKVILPVKYDRIQWNAYGFPRNYIVQEKNKAGVINARGKIIIPVIYDKVETSDHNMFFTTLDRKTGYADTIGNFIPPVYDKLELFESNLFRAARIVRIKNNTTLLFGLINKTNDTVVPLEYEYIWKNGSGGGRLFKKEGTYCLLDHKKDTLIPYGTIIRGFDNSSVYIGKDDILTGKKNAKWGLLTGDGRWITEQIYDEIEDLRSASYNNSGLGWVVRVNGKEGILHRKGEVYIEPQYDDLDIINITYDYQKSGQDLNNRFCLKIQQGNYIGLLKSDKSILLQPKFTYSNYFNNRYYFSNSDSIYFLEVYSSNSFPKIEALKKFAYINDELILFKRNEEFIFCKLIKSKETSFLLPQEYRGYDQRIRKIGSFYEVYFERDTFCLDRNGKQIEHPFRGQTIEKEVYGNLILKNKKNWFTYCDSSGKNLFDTLYRSIVWEEPYLWVQTEKGKVCPAGKNNSYWNYCHCGWQRFDEKAKRLDKIIYDFPVKLEEIEELVFVDGKAALFNRTLNKLTIDPLYSDIVRIPGANLYFGVFSDSTFVIITNTGKKITKEIFNSYIPLVRRNSAFTNRKNAKLGHLYFLLQNVNGEILMDEKGTILKDKKLIAKTILQSVQLPDKDRPYQFPYSSNVRYSGLNVNYSYKQEPDADLEKALHWFMNYLLTEHRGRYTAFPGSGGYSTLCNSFSMVQGHLSANDSWYFQYFNKEAFSVSTGNIFGSNYYVTQYNHNFVRTENGYRKITLEDLFKDDVSVSQLLNELIVSDIAKREDLNIDCSNPNSFFKMTNGEFSFSDKGLVLHVHARPEFRSIIPWADLLPYAKPGGTIEYFAKEKK